MNLISLLRIGILLMLLAANMFQTLTLHEARKVIAALQDTIVVQSKIIALQDKPGFARSSVSHVSPEGHCPTGAKTIDKAFTERDGTRQAACFDPGGDGSIDVLRAGELVELDFTAPEGARPSK